MEVKVIPKIYNEVELSFLEDFWFVYKKYPFKVFELMKILSNEEISYKRDKTLIITISKISSISVNDLIEFINVFYQSKIITKYIYQKEFIIIHFNNEYITQSLTNKTYYMYIDYYFTLLKITNEVYLSPQININNIKEEVDLVFIHNKEYYIFKKDKGILPYTTYYINLFFNYHDFKNRIFVKYYISDEMKEQEILKLINQ